jgi:hypothetical protein
MTLRESFLDLPYQDEDALERAGIAYRVSNFFLCTQDYD